MAKPPDYSKGNKGAATSGMLPDTALSGVPSSAGLPLTRPMTGKPQRHGGIVKDVSKGSKSKPISGGY